MKTQIACLLLIAGIATSTAQRRTIDVDDFSKISFGLPETLHLSQGSNESVEIEASEEAFERMKFVADGSKLKIRSKRSNSWKNWNNMKVTIYVTMKNIEEINLSGSGQIIGKNKFETDDLSLSISGSGNMEINTNSEDVDLRISGSGKIGLEGSADRADVSISGSGSVKGENFEVNVCKASISGSGSIITARKEIDARISGSGSVRYNGNPDQVSGHSSGSGKVRKL